MNEIQNTILEIFKAVKQICQDCGITYYAIGGTCIGAVRHSGFIPWDDDMDIAVPIEDFERLKIELKKRLPVYYTVYDCDHVLHYNHVFIKVVDERTTFIEKADYEYQDCYKGIFLDIMPLSGVPSNSRGENRFKRLINYYSRLSYIRRYPSNTMQTASKRALSKILHIFNPIIPFNYYTSKWYRILQDNPVYGSNQVGYVWFHKMGDLVFPKEWFEGTKELKFEDTTISCPKDWNLYLKAQFGEYMKLPPLDERQSGHEGFVSTTIPYKKINYNNGSLEVLQ